MSIERRMTLVSTEPHEAEVVQAFEPFVTISFTTSDLKVVDEHLGSATRLARYKVTSTSHEFIGVTEFSETRQDGNENKLIDKFDALAGCDAVFCLAVGASAVKQLMERQIQPIKLGERSSIIEVLAYVQQEVQDGETPWIRRALQRFTTNSDDRLSSLLDEGWSE